MNTGVTLTLPSISFDLSIDSIKEEARQLLSRGIITRNQPLYVLCEYLPAREWLGIENQLERSGYLLRDRIIDLIGAEKWDSD
ncbi:conserved hypothetical protein [Hyella patelloides LEGE 07179]|uniref:DUF4327 domain-containing protein n=1 Tax=Hyella patelloides LEGE 07179 TaxID=945734 RepID=A0A563VR34_9CYAN|nr:DUF4327 family protein [Hyella patelloides]VEP13922.1 conserved hypothetical protein [Hyella patelloides LEGE 07179]